jgi:hypothetical protein
MTFKTKTKARFQSFLRRLGLLCKKPIEPTKRIRISRTINPDGSTTQHERLIKQPLFEGNTFESELHIYNEIKKTVQPPRKSKKQKL